jgi:hypothetical protein
VAQSELTSRLLQFYINVRTRIVTLLTQCKYFDASCYFHPNASRAAHTVRVSSNQSFRSTSLILVLRNRAAAVRHVGRNADCSLFCRDGSKVSQLKHGPPRTQKATCFTRRHCSHNPYVQRKSAVVCCGSFLSTERKACKHSPDTVQ